MTEAEAMTKVCCGPFAGRLPYGSASDAEELAVHGTDPAYAAETAARWPCIGSACMAWRVAFEQRGPIVERQAAPPLSTKPEGADWGYESVDPATSSGGGEWVRWGPGIAHGHCGLAGAPS